MADNAAGRVREVYVASYRRLVGQLTGVTGTHGIALAGNGPHVAAVGLGDDPDGGIPVVGAAVSSDSGATWETIDLPVDFGEITSLAVTDGGTAVVTAHDASARFITPDGALVIPPKPLEFEQVAAAGQVIYGWTSAELFVSNDADLAEVWVRVDDGDFL